MNAIIEVHGGTVEKFIGDAVMAVFGVPAVHEDDALRAVRAALEMREALPELGVQARIGVNTGEVVTGTAERLATGDAVNVAARLEQAAPPGEILIGEQTLRLVKGAVETEPVEPLELKGKPEPVPAWRLLAVHDLPARRHELRFVGRAAELERLQQGWRRVLEEDRCEIITIVGDAGVGKSRLSEELLASVEARVVRGRCLPYGEGITYWPVVEVLKQVDALPSDPAAAASLRSLLGDSDQGTSADEIAWAFRKLLEEHAPLVVVFDDIQWGEETFLDLVEHVALLSSRAALLLLCMARLDLTERRPQWPVALRLEPLEQADVDSLLPETLPARMREKINHAAGGNPLFIDEMLALTAQGEGELDVPPHLQALLAARLEQIDDPERSVLERGSIEGEIFHRGAIQALSEDSRVTSRLAALVRKELIRPDESQLPVEDAFRFRHLLIRDAAYDALPKAMRAELHQRFAAWLEQKGRDLVELDEIVGFHLEQAARYKQELGQSDLELAERAASRLSAAGRRGLWRGDHRGATPLLRRALELTRPLRLDVHLELDFARALENLREGADVAEAAAERARAVGREPERALAHAVAVHLRSYTGTASIDESEAAANEALPLVEAVSDDAGLVFLWTQLGQAANYHGRFRERVVAAERAIRHARIAGQRVSYLFDLDMALVYGPTPADEGLALLDEHLPAKPLPGTLLHRAELLAMLGRFEEAWRIEREAGERLRDLTGRPPLPTSAEIASMEGKDEDVARFLGAYCDWLEQRKRMPELSTYAARRGRALWRIGRSAEAEALARLSRELGDEEDAVTQAFWRQVQALVCIDRAEYGEAERLAREAVATTERMDGLNLQGDALCDLAEVLATAGRTDEAAGALEQALERYERKKNLAMVAQVRPKLEELRKMMSA